MTLLLRRKHRTTAATTAQPKGRDARPRRGSRWRAAASVAIAALSLAPLGMGPFAPGAANADAIQNSGRSSKLTWRVPDVGDKPTDGPADKRMEAPAETPKRPAFKAPKSKVQVVERAAAEVAAPAATESRAKVDPSQMKVEPTTTSPKSNSYLSSTILVREAGAAASTRVEVVADSEQESAVEKAQDDGHALKPSRLDRAARPYSRSMARKSAVQRLGDAEPSTFSGGAVDADTAENPIRQVAAVKEVGPNLVPEAKAEKPSARERELIERAGLQEGAAEPPDGPFDNPPPRNPPPDSVPPSEGPDANPPTDQLAQGGLLPGRCPTPRDLKPLDQISINIAAEPGPFPAECGLGDETFVPRNFACTTYAWKASSLCHKPLYFEDYDLERYGHTASPLLQPFISAAQFYLVLPILPYKMGLEPPGECIYALGYYRPGSCAPRIIPNVPISLRAGLLEAGVWVAGVALIP